MLGKEALTNLGHVVLKRIVESPLWRNGSGRQRFVETLEAKVSEGIELSKGDLLMISWMPVGWRMLAMGSVERVKLKKESDRLMEEVLVLEHISPNLINRYAE